MRRFVMASIISLVVTPIAAFAQTWNIDSNHSAAQFSARHMMVSTVRGELGRITGTVSFDGKDVSTVSVETSIDTTALDTRVEDRNTHLKSADFLEVDKYPTITFTSKRATPVGDGRFNLTGDLTIHGVTKEVVLDVEGPTAQIVDPRGNARIGATATTTINRKDFGLTWNRMLEAGGLVVSEEVGVTLDLELMRAVDSE